MVKAVSRLLASGSGSLAELRKPKLIQGLARGSNNKRLRRTMKQERIQNLQQEESRLRADTSQDYGMIPYVDRDISNLQDRVNSLRTGNRESLPAQILINMVQQQSQQQNLITNLQEEQQREKDDTTAGLYALTQQVSRTQSDTGSRQPSLSRQRSDRSDTVPRSPLPSRRRERSQARSPSPERERPVPIIRPERPDVPIGQEQPPSGIVRRGRGGNKPISKYNVQNMSVETKAQMGLPPDADHKKVRKLAIELGVSTKIEGTDRVVPDRLIFSEIIKAVEERHQARLQEIQNQPVPQQSGDETDREVRDYLGNITEGE